MCAAHRVSPGEWEARRKVLKASFLASSPELTLWAACIMQSMAQCPRSGRLKGSLLHPVLCYQYVQLPFCVSGNTQPVFGNAQPTLPSTNGSRATCGRKCCCSQLTSVLEGIASDAALKLAKGFPNLHLDGHVQLKQVLQALQQGRIGWAISQDASGMLLA